MNRTGKIGFLTVLIVAVICLVVGSVGTLVLYKNQCNFKDASSDKSLLQKVVCVVDVAKGIPDVLDMNNTNQEGEEEVVKINLG